MTSNKVATERRRELTDRILDRTPYCRGNETRERIADKMGKLLNEDDLTVLSLATNLTNGATCFEGKNRNGCGNYTALYGCSKCASYIKNVKIN